MSNLTLGSLFDGSGGFPFGGMLSGIIPVWASEIEPFPIRVTTKRLPQMKHYGDISTINGAEIEPVDIITFGSPCTDMSVAGKRAGLEGKQSVLFYEAIRIIKEMREKTGGKKPRFIVWENVPGAFSSNKGEDFKAVLKAIASVKDETIIVPEPPKGKWASAGEIVGDNFSIAWRTLDSQYFGVAQRRRRIYLVADFASGCAGKILFESEGLSGYFTQSKHPWETAPAIARESFDETSPSVMFENHSQDTRYKEVDVAPTVSATYGTGGNNQPFITSAGFCTEHSANSRGIGYEEEISPTLRAGVVPATVFGICSNGSNSMKSDNPNSGIYEADTSRTIDANGGNPSCNQGGMAVVCLQGSMIGRNDNNGPQGNGINNNISFTLNATDRHAVYSMTTGCFMQINKDKAPTLASRDYKDPAVVTEPVYAIDRETFNCGQNFARNLGITENGVASTLNAQGPSAVALNEDKVSAVVEPNYTVRRLTPKECALLQGFPIWWCDNLETINPTEEEIDFWADVFETHRKVMGKATKPKSRSQIIKWLESPYSDSAEYKMWGNGVALPCVRFVLSGIVWAVK